MSPPFRPRFGPVSACNVLHSNGLQTKSGRVTLRRARISSRPLAPGARIVQAMAPLSEVISPQSRRGRPAKFALPKPAAPFDHDPAKIASIAFDRASGQPIPAHALQTYAEALAQYHLHPESKFLGGDYRDRGPTTRRHIRVCGICHIGKEANELDRQQVLGVDGNARPDYGLTADSVAQLRDEIAALADTLGITGAGKALRMAPRRLAAILSGKVCADETKIRALSSNLPTARAEAEILLAERGKELQHLRQMVHDQGLREAARKHGVDPSNLAGSLESPLGMYLKRAIVENSGPLRWLDLKLQFTDTGLPKPLILVGGNGGGKTNFLSLVADALFEAAAIHYENVLPQRGLGRAWFRVVGGRNLTVGTEGGFSILEFDHAGTSHFFKEKAGKVDAETVRPRVDESIAGQIAWPTDGAIKEFPLDDETSRKLFEEGVYAYFPSSRSEIPHWLNREAIPETEFESGQTFSKRLVKPIYVDRSLDKFKQWVLGIITDSRCDIGLQFVDGQPKLQPRGNIEESIVSSHVLEVSNNLLRAVMADSEVRFVWVGRKSSDKIAIAKGDNVILPNLDALSSGQSILLGMFGTLLKYGDFSQIGGGVDISSINGICVIDEIDAHIHVELQNKTLPHLIKMFPKVQFILSSHSPIFVLGMEREFGTDGIQVVEMPDGTPVGSETYVEFGKALEALSATGAFTEKVVAHARAAAKPIVYVEGETDAPYLKRAAKLLGKQALLEECDIEWIGAKDQNGQGFLTGKDALKQVLSVLRANPKLAKQKILLLNDNDSNSPDQDYDGVSVRKIPTNGKNTKVLAGIENLLSEDCLEIRWYQTIEKDKPNGDKVSTITIRKSDLCGFLCEHGTAEQFAAFEGALAIIEAFIAAESVSSTFN